MRKLWAILDLFRKGNAVAEPGLIKNGGMGLITVLTTLLLSFSGVANAFDWSFRISQEEAATIAAGIATVLHIVFTVITSDKVGLPPKDPDG